MRTSLSFLLAVTMFLAVIGAAPAQAQSGGAEPLVFWVNINTDAVDTAPGNGMCATAQGGCSLRAAVMEANAHAGPDTIALTPGDFGLTITGSGEDQSATGDLDILDPVFIRGEGRGSTRILCSTGEGCFDLKTSASLTGVTLSGGGVRLSYPPYPGTELNLSDCEIEQGSVNLANTRARIHGCRIHHGSGVSLIDGAAVSLQNTAIDANNVQGIYAIGSTVHIYNSTLSANQGGGIFINGGQLHIANSTISGNQGGSGILAQNASVEIASSTIVKNVASTAGSGGGISASNGATVALRNTILADNTNATAPNCSAATGATVTSKGYNILSSTTGCTVSAVTGDQFNVDPLIESMLKDNGGHTQTHTLQTKSRAIDRGNPGGCTDVDGKPLTIDQRGYARPQDGDGDSAARCDVGAVELIQRGQPGAWACYDLATPNACRVWLTDMEMLSASDGWAVGEQGGILRWNGSVWSPFSAPNQPYTLYDLDMLSTNEGWAVGYQMRDERAALVRWNGTGWSEVMPPISDPHALTGVSMTSTSSGWAVGEGALFRWNGSAWSQWTSPVERLMQVEMISAADGWASEMHHSAMDPARVMHWNGSTWSEVPLQMDASLPWLDVTGPGQVWLAGEGPGNKPMIVRSNGGGWTADPLPVVAYSSYWLGGIRMLSATDGWAWGVYTGGREGESLLLHWDGSSWSIVPVPMT
ncbi:MAG: right-handed parallel beta-helix repeat-containing protein, partial [Chloroflexi bacterium]